jgi:hypothetical protein
MPGHYEVEPENKSRPNGVLRVSWVEPGKPRSRLWNMAGPRLAQLGEAITAYMTEHPEAAADPASLELHHDDQIIPLPRRSTRIPDDPDTYHRGPDGAPPS